MKKAIGITVLAVIAVVLIWRVQATIVAKMRLSSLKPRIEYARVEIALPEMRTIDEFVECWGEAAARRSVAVYSNYPGKVRALYREAGSRVREGDTLAVIDRDMQPLEYAAHSVIAPTTGIVARRMVDPGAQITQQTPLYTVENLDSMLVRISVAPSDIAKIRAGMAVLMTTEGTGNAAINGVVERIAPFSDSRSGATIVEITANKSELRPGMAVTARIVTQRREAMFVPALSIVSHNERSYAFVYRSGVARKLPVNSGVRQADQREVCSGIGLSDTVISSGTDFLSDGDTVVIRMGAAK